MAEIVLKVYSGTQAYQTETVLFEQELTDYEVGDWTEFVFPEAIPIDKNKDLWIGYKITQDEQAYAAGCDDGPALIGKGDLINDGGSWLDVYDYGIDRNWNIRGYVNTEGAEHDVKLVELKNCSGQVDPTNPIIPTVTLKNVGQNDEQFSVFCKIVDAKGDTVYQDELQHRSLAVDEQDDYTFKPFSAQPNTLYSAVAGLRLQTDTNPDYNQAAASFRTFVEQRQLVLVEIFTATWCHYCPSAANGADELITNGHPVAVIEYHTSDDYKDHQSKQRQSFYGLSGFPNACFDGAEVISGGSTDESLYPYYQAVVTEQYDMKTMCDVSIRTRNKADRQYHFDFHIANHGDYPSGDVRLFAAITESGIQEEWHGLTELDFVARMMIPRDSGALGNAFDVEADSAVLSFDVQLDDSWAAEHCEIVAFVQNTDTREVYNTVKQQLTQTTQVDQSNSRQSRVDEFKLYDNYPNPFNMSTTIRFALNGKTRATLDIFSVSGQKVRTLIDADLESGQHRLSWDGRDNNGRVVPSGLYVYRVRTEHGSVSKKLLLLK